MTEAGTSEGRDERRCVMPRRSTLARGRGTAGKDGARLARLIDEAVVDCRTESEATLGFYNMIDDILKVPFTAQVLGMEVPVQGVHLSDADEILVSCRRGRFRQAPPILHRRLPRPVPKGAEWVDAYRQWARGR
jgi:hypothetical protein